ncbi:D-alanyl-D-alanine carboxypeptidase/D-alanyl-D-alanine endopeptidase [Poriferisphaera sp. WC338]|uniref:D-alanyl-D-alanine carboxypeptidase/D-alanyl-D-alanine endopeptidase n=1 Tax=Poriferisphaera sp. WC338 TaxID=3425129 RepID=UPI003D81833B
MQHNRRVLKTLMIMISLFVTSVASGVDLESPLRHLIQSSNLGKTTYSITVKDLDYDVYLAEINADTPMIPASNMKILTTAMALDILGADYIFETRLSLLDSKYTDGLPALLIRGDGDPAFCDPALLRDHDLTVENVLDQWLKAIEATNVKHFSKIILDDRIFDYQFVHPSWEQNDLMKHYGAQISGLNFYLNCIDFTFVPSNYIGQSPRIMMFPDVPYLQTINRAKTGKTDNYWVNRRLDTNDFSFHGTIKNHPFQPKRMTVHDPAVFFTQYLIYELEKRGIKVDYIARPDEDQTLPPGEELHVVRTTLPLVISRTNQDSVNLFAESLFKRSGHQITGEPGGWNNGAAAMRNVMHSRVGPSASAINISDGSGLSRENKVSSRMFINLLENVYEDPEKSQVFRESLSYAGRTPENERIAVGSLKRAKRMKNLKPGHWVFAKTGHLTGVTALSGYYMFPSSTEPDAIRTIAFSFLFNNIKAPVLQANVRKLQDNMIDHIQNAVMMSESVGR